MDSKAQHREEEDWKEIIARILEKDRCTALILGYIDTGKTSFVKYAAKKIKEGGKRVSIIDCDVGQSSIGPPGCMGLLNNSGEEIYYFIGDIYPYDHVKMITGLMELRSRADSPYILIDTTGLIFWEGRRLKRAKITATEPDLILAFQRDRELGGILRDTSGYETITIPVVGIPFTSREKRRTIRKTLWKRYLASAQMRVYPLKEVTVRNTFLFSGEECEKDSVKGVENVLWCEQIPEGVFAVADRYGKDEEMVILKKGFERGLIVGFIKGTTCLGIGIIVSIDFERKELYVLTGVEGAFDFIEFGRLRITEDGEEMGRVYNLTY